MYLNNETRWCQAKYAMEVFCAMMGEEDIMNIYAMNRSEVLTLKGNDSERVQKVHAMTSKYSGTPFSTVTRAGKALSNESSDYERWLVVLTDGSFDNTTQLGDNMPPAIDMRCDCFALLCFRMDILN